MRIYLQIKGRWLQSEEYYLGSVVRGVSVTLGAPSFSWDSCVRSSHGKWDWDSRSQTFWFQDPLKTFKNYYLKIIHMDPYINIYSLLIQIMIRNLMDSIINNILYENYISKQKINENSSIPHLWKSLVSARKTAGFSQLLQHAVCGKVFWLKRMQPHTKLKRKNPVDSLTGPWGPPEVLGPHFTNH